MLGDLTEYEQTLRYLCRTPSGVRELETFCLNRFGQVPSSVVQNVYGGR